MAATTHDHLIQAFERRFDYLSARIVAGEVLDNAGVRKADAYDAGAWERILKATESLPRSQSLVAALSEAGKGGGAAVAQVKPKVEAPVQAVEAPVAAAAGAAAPAAVPAEVAGDAGDADKADKKAKKV
jgi:hypothetical protein